MSEVAIQLQEVEDRVTEACRASGRSRQSVELIAVSKTFPAAAVAEAYQAGQRHFGESRLQEAESKVAELPESIHWHFIGRVQRNKVRKILPLFEVVHGVDSLRLATHTDRIAADLGIHPGVFLQVNIGREESKGGFDPDRIESEMETLVALHNLRILGLMCIPPVESDPQASRRWFAQLRGLRDRLVACSGAAMPCLSMGMSGDYEQAIAEGATHVRVGSAIFGNRSYRVDGELG